MLEQLWTGDNSTILCNNIALKIVVKNCPVYNNTLKVGEVTGMRRQSRKAFGKIIICLSHYFLYVHD